MYHHHGIVPKGTFFFVVVRLFCGLDDYKSRGPAKIQRGVFIKGGSLLNALSPLRVRSPRSRSSAKCNSDSELRIPAVWEGVRELKALLGVPPSALAPKWRHSSFAPGETPHSTLSHRDPPALSFERLLRLASEGACRGAVRTGYRRRFFAHHSSRRNGNARPS